MATKSKTIDPKCIRCALLSGETAKSTHDCWVPGTCPSKRHYIKNREGISQQRRKKRIEVVHQVVTPQVVYGNLLIWRELRQDSPIHAIGADIWDGERRLAVVTPVHCAGWLPSQVHSYIQQTLNILENAYGFQKFAGQIIEHPEQCPIRPCPLHSSVVAVGSVGGSD
jgi:hypothetical protein